MSDAKLPEYRCGMCGGSEFVVDTAFGIPARVLVRCKTLAATGFPGSLCGHTAVGPHLPAAFEAISRKEAPDAPA